MLFKKRELVERPKVEKKFSLKNPEDIAIIITYSAFIIIVVIIIILLVKFGGLIPNETSSEISNNINSLIGGK